MSLDKFRSTQLKNRFFTLLIVFFFGSAAGIGFHRYLSSPINEWFSNITSPKEPDLTGYQGTAKITAIQAFLFYDHLGSVSPDLFKKKDLTLWNTIIGEGDAHSASKTTLILVKVEGRDILSTRHAKVGVEVTNSQGVQLLNESRTFDMYDSYRQSYIPVLIPNTGCEAITVSAKLVGKGLDPSSMSQTVPFSCGE